MSAATSEIRQKVDLMFAKQGPARFYSHHDLMRLFERALRRAELPCRMTQGFNPKPRMVFPAPLSVGVASACEHLELEFTEPVPPHLVRQGLAPLMLEGMRLLTVTRLPKRRRGRKVGRITYRIDGLVEPRGPGRETLARAADWLRGLDRLGVERTGKRGARTVDVTASVETIDCEADRVELVIAPQPRATARPDELAALLAQRTGADPAAVRITRVRMELRW